MWLIPHNFFVNRHYHMCLCACVHTCKIYTHVKYIMKIIYLYTHIKYIRKIICEGIFKFYGE